MVHEIKSEHGGGDTHAPIALREEQRISPTFAFVLLNFAADQKVHLWLKRTLISAWIQIPIDRFR